MLYEDKQQIQHISQELLQDSFMVIVVFVVVWIWVSVCMYNKRVNPLGVIFVDDKDTVFDDVSLNLPPRIPSERDVLRWEVYYAL